MEALDQKLAAVQARAAGLEAGALPPSACAVPLAEAAVAEGMLISGRDPAAEGVIACDFDVSNPNPNANANPTPHPKCQP